MDWLGIIHTVTAGSALLFGPLVFFRRKGTRTHRLLGYGYVVSMLLLNATALMIYDLFDGFGVFHWAALVSLVTLASGIVPALLRRPQRTWIVWHYMGMNWSYVGLCAAAAAEFLTRLPAFIPRVLDYVPGSFFWNAVGAGTFIICGTGWYLVNRRRPGFALVQRMLDNN
ncbi:MAG: DUF2306 domain-containing protein [Gammaproteobacteria bacterium]|nr:DUF2306 domain-containing protein [Gammaproteobacteria bacterium]